MSTEQQSEHRSSVGASFIGYLQQTNLQIWILYFLFVGLSLYATTTASGSEVYKYLFVHGGGMSPIIKQWVIVLFSIVVTASMPLVCKARYLRIGLILYSLLSLALLALILVNPITINGATRWTNILGVSVQPSEFWKIWIIGILSLMSCRYQGYGSPKTRWAYWIFYGIPIFALMGLTAYVGLNNASTGMIYGLVIALLCLIYKMPFKWYVSTFAFLALFGGLLLVALFTLPEDKLPYRAPTWKNRIESKLFAKDEGEENKFVLRDETRQEQYALIALANSKFIGRGFGNSTIKDLLPMANSDYIFAVLIEELGAVGLFGIPILYVWWFLIVAALAKREQSQFNRYLLYGIGIFFPLQALVNFVVVSGIITTGQPLPLISAGGSSFLANSIAIGVMLIISRGQYEYRAQKQAELQQEEGEAIAAPLAEEPNSSQS